MKRVERARADSGILSEPFAFPRSGNYNWGSSGPNRRSSRAYYWSSHTYSAAYAHYQSFHSTYFGPQDGYLKGYGYAVRCSN